MSREKLHAFASTLYTTLQASLWEKEGWFELKQVQTKGDYEYVHTSNLLPSDSIKKHRLVESLITFGLFFPCILLVYAPGSNIGNLHFLWKVPGDDPSQCFESSLPTVEAIKKVLPRYHTHAMRTAMFRKFAPSVKQLLCIFPTET